MAIYEKIRKTYYTSDGKEFDEYLDAKKHEKELYRKRVDGIGFYALDSCFNILDDLLTRKHKDWYEENIKKEASKYKTPTEFAKNARRAYQKWLYDYGKPMDWLKQDDEQE